MSTVDPEPEVTPAERSRIGWRRLQLELAGLDRMTATEGALRFTLDVHALTDLVDRGCPPMTAYEILR